MTAASHPSEGPSLAAPARSGSARRYSVSIWLLILSNLLVFQVTYFHKYLWSPQGIQLQRNLYENADLVSLTAVASHQHHANLSSSGSSYILDFPRGEAVALPSVILSEADDKKVDRMFYGGKGDKAHLGGFTEIDLHGVSPAVWKSMVTYFGVKSVLDVGCGRGISTSWFALHGVDALCVEGSHDAVSQTMLPDPATQVVEHDFSRGPWWPPRTIDAVWCVEFLEHVGRNFHHNYLPAFRKAALIFVTHSIWGGWHHVEVHDEVWWVSKMESYGFRYSEELSQKVREVASIERGSNTASVIPGKSYNAQHITMTMKVFINPVVAALPEHAHLFSEHGCYLDLVDGKILHRECDPSARQPEVSRMPESFYPLNLTAEMDTAWENLVKENINLGNIH